MPQGLNIVHSSTRYYTAPGSQSASDLTTRSLRERNP